MITRHKTLGLLAAAMLSIGITDRAAADILRALYSPQPMANWTGFYVGGNVGYGWAPDSSRATSSLGGTSASSFEMTGVVAGGQLGLLAQVSGPWVAGIETDIQGSWQEFNGPGGNTTNLNNSAGFAPPASERDRIEWFGTTRGRFGYAADRVLVFGSAGVAYAAVRTKASTTTGFTIIDSSPVKLGWAAGGGIEVMLGRNWTVRGEYLHLDLGRQTDRYSTLGGAITANLEQRITDDIVRVAVNYWFK